MLFASKHQYSQLLHPHHSKRNSRLVCEFRHIYRASSHCPNVAVRFILHEALAENELARDVRLRTRSMHSPKPLIDTAKVMCLHYSEPHSRHRLGPSKMNPRRV